MENQNKLQKIEPKAQMTLVQCDFDGTITEKDVAFLLLDAFADKSWKQLLAKYIDGKISVGDFNTRAFAMIKADKQTLVGFVRNKAKLRAGFYQLLGYCRRKSFRFVIVSNGLDFYIDTILRAIGVEDIEVFAAQTRFIPTGVKVKYIGSDGNQLQSGFKESYIRLFLKQGYRVIYIGNGLSDTLPARLAHHIFARDELLAYCNQKKLNHTSFIDLNDVARGLEVLE